MTHACLARSAGLAAGEIHVWNARIDHDDHRATADSLRMLDHGEQARAAQFSSERDRARFIQTHGMLRQVLAGYCDADCASLTFASNCHGKPFLASPANGHDLQFSLAHSGSRCLLALRRQHAIGVDLEQLRELPRALEIARSRFTAAESAALAALRGTRRRDAFFVLWVHKEAMVKALGIDLAHGLGRIEFELDAPAEPRLRAYGQGSSIAQSWSVLRLDPAPGYTAALASPPPIGPVILQDWEVGQRGQRISPSLRL
jgi:4'-phosphopantetheinyl transferase